MKFDKLMEIGFKILVCITCIVLVVGFVSCCRFYAVPASAVEIDAGGQAQIDEYLQAYESTQADIDLSWNKDEDGNSSAHLRVYGLQQALLADNWRTYGSMDFSVAPDTVTFSGYGTSGFYRLTVGGALRVCTVYTFPDWSSSNFGNIFISADDYSYSLVCDNPSAAECCCYNDNYNGSLFYEFQVKARITDWSQNVHIGLIGSGIGYSKEDWMGINNGSGTTSKSFDFRGSDRGYNYIPVYNKIEPQYGFPNPLFALGVNYTLPEFTVDTSAPWEYYNDILLPYIREQYPDLPDLDDFLVFPDGYYPEVLPTEPTPPNYEDTENTKIVPIIVGIPIPVDVLDDLGEVIDVLDILADLLPGGGIQFNIDGVTFTFPRDGDSVVINGKQYPLPLPDVEIDGHTINLPDSLHFDCDGIHFTINPDGTIREVKCVTVNINVW